MFLMFLCAFTNTFLGQRRNVQDYFVWHAWAPWLMSLCHLGLHGDGASQNVSTHVGLTDDSTGT